MPVKLFELSESKLMELQSQYPYSYLIPLAIGRKKLQESGAIHVNYLTDLIGKTNNPGLAISSVFEKTDYVLCFDDMENDKLDAIDSKIMESSEIEKSKDRGYGLNERIASEKLADIYRQQGLYEQADEISRRISLKNKNN